MAHILVTTDFSPSAAVAYEHAMKLVKNENDRITLCHAIVDLKTAPQGAPLAPPQSSPGVSAEIDAAEAQLKKLSLELGGAPVSCLVLTGPSVAEAIADYANEDNTDYIVIATHGRTGFRHMVLGSVTEAVVRHARVPVLTVPVPADS